jgi:hypothetical protein
MHTPIGLSHVTAAQQWSLPLPQELERQTELDVMCRSGAGPVRRQGCIGHRGLERRTVVTHQGLPVTSLADTWVDLAEVMHRGLDLDDLVVAGDVAARLLERHGDDGECVTGVEQLATCLSGRVRPRGKVILSSALPLISPRSKSPMETRARLVFARAGLPSPELNVAVHFDGTGGDATTGGWLLEGDFVWRKQRVIAEYQGKHHATIGQRAVDASRRVLAEEEGWTFFEVFAGDVYTRPKRLNLLRRLARALDVPDSALTLH